MAHDNIEIEIKVKVENAGPLVAFLEKNAEFQSEKRQVDEYYTPKHRNFIEGKRVREWLRLREAEGNNSINYKYWYFDESGKSTHCDEVETSIGDADQLRKIFSALDYTSIVKVDKVRKVWIYKDYEIGMDSVVDLGNFVEIEYNGKDASRVDPKKITVEMVDFLKKVGCGKIVRDYVGYPFLLLFPEDSIEEEV